MADENDKVTDRDDQDQKTEEQQAAEQAERDAAKAAEDAKQEKDDGAISREEYAKIQDEFERTKKALKKANEEAAKNRHDLKPYRDLDVDPDRVKALIEKEREEEIRKAEEAGKWDELRDRLKSDHQKELEKREAALKEADDKVSRMKATLEKHLIGEQLTAEIAKHGASPKLLMPHVRDRVKAIETEDGDYKVGILDDNGELREGFGISDLIEESKKDPDLGSLFPAPDKSGTGANQASQDKASKPKNKQYKRRSEMSQQEKVDAIAELTISGYNKLPL